GHADREHASLGAIEDATLGIGVARGNADGAEHGIVELHGGGDIIGTDHDVREHCLLSYLVRRKPSPETRLAARSWAPRAHVALASTGKAHGTRHAKLHPQRFTVAIGARRGAPARKTRLFILVMRERSPAW